MENIQIDWVIVVFAAVLNMVIGYFWYSKWLFGPFWAKLSKHRGKEKENEPYGRTLVLSFITSLVIAFFLSFFEGFMEVTTVTDGMFVGFVLWLGFVATTQFASVIWCEKPFSLFMINTGYKLVAFLVMGGVIGA